MNNYSTNNCHCGVPRVNASNTRIVCFRCGCVWNKSSGIITRGLNCESLTIVEHDTIRLSLTGQTITLFEYTRSTQTIIAHYISGKIERYTNIPLRTWVMISSGVSSIRQFNRHVVSRNIPELIHR